MRLKIERVPVIALTQIPSSRRCQAGLNTLNLTIYSRSPFIRQTGGIIIQPSLRNIGDKLTLGAICYKWISIKSIRHMWHTWIISQRLLPIPMATGGTRRMSSGAPIPLTVRMHNSFANISINRPCDNLNWPFAKNSFQCALKSCRSFRKLNDLSSAIVAGTKAG